MSGEMQQTHGPGGRGKGKFRYGWGERTPNSLEFIKKSPVPVEKEPGRESLMNFY